MISCKLPATPAFCKLTPYVSFSAVTLNVVKGLGGGDINPPQMRRCCGWLSMT